MKKQKKYSGVRFNAEVLKEAVGMIQELIARSKKEILYSSFKVNHDDSSWSYDTFEEFLPDFRKYKNFATIRICSSKAELEVDFYSRYTEVIVQAEDRIQIEAIFDIFEKNISACMLPPAPPESAKRPIVFIGHGRSSAWRDLKDHLQDKHGFIIESYESGARAGHTIRDILEDMILSSSFAVLVLTGEDEQDDGSLRARQNVIHETGLFQGRLGFPRAILLLEEGVEQFSNVQGVQYIPFAKNNIKETFGEVLATLRREFPT